MSDFRKSQIDHAQQVLAQPDLTRSEAQRALDVRIARHVLRSSEITRDVVIVRVPRAIFEAGLYNRRLAASAAPATPIGGGDAA